MLDLLSYIDVIFKRQPTVYHQFLFYVLWLAKNIATANRRQLWNRRCWLVSIIDRCMIYANFRFSQLYLLPALKSCWWWVVHWDYSVSSAPFVSELRLSEWNLEILAEMSRSRAWQKSPLSGNKKSNWSAILICFIISPFINIFYKNK